MSLSRKRGILICLVILYLVANYFVYTSATATTEPINDSARSGRLVFQKYNCVACHQIYGLGGHMGPDLTNVMTEKGEPYVRSFVENGTQRMPKFEMSTQELDDLVSYFDYLGKTSEYQNSNYSFTWYGTVNQQEPTEKKL